MELIKLDGGLHAECQQIEFSIFDLAESRRTKCSGADVRIMRFFIGLSRGCGEVYGGKAAW
jgi:hypothetical protein